MKYILYNPFSKWYAADGEACSFTSHKDQAWRFDSVQVEELVAILGKQWEIQKIPTKPQMDEMTGLWY